MNDKNYLSPEIDYMIKFLGETIQDNLGDFELTPEKINRIKSAAGTASDSLSKANSICNTFLRLTEIRKLNDESFDVILKNVSKIDSIQSALSFFTQNRKLLNSDETTIKSKYFKVIMNRAESAEILNKFLKNGENSRGCLDPR